MPLSAGDKLGPYEILAQIGKGGMGEVYRARDPRLGREIAIKVSAERFTERFDREARVVASLNHPNICTLHDVGPNYLVMELVEGEAPKGPLPFDEAMRIARQIAAAMTAAHEKGVTHRDLKPANIKIKPDGSVKVLDFGLAKVAPASAGESRSENSPTLSMAATQAGQILGTAAYMAPEQAKGKPVDKRADIWAFAVVLYELLTGQRLFKGDDISEILAGVIKEKPDLSAVPAKVRPLLEQCLEKDPAKRLRDIGDMDLLLVQRTPASRPRLGVWSMVAVAATAALAVVSFIHFREKPPAPPELTKFEIFAPEKTTMQKFQVSPDGRKIAFFGDGADGRGGLWVRSFDSTESKRVADTPANPPLFFWSADSRYVAWGTLEGSPKLMKVDVTGGPPEPVCDVPNIVIGGSWKRDGTILFGSFSGPIWRVSASGGTPAALTKLDPSRQDAGHFSPVFLPDGKHFLYLRQSGLSENTGIYVGSLDSKPDQQSSKRLIATNMSPVWVPSPDPGFVNFMFLREGSLMVQSLDLAKLDLTGDPVRIASNLGSFAEFGYFSTSTNGVLAYRTGTPGGNTADQPTWFDRKGKSLGPAMAAGIYTEMSLSRDGARAAVHRYDNGAIVKGDLWLADFGRNAFTRLTSAPSEPADPVWSPDGSHVAYASSRGGGTGLYQKASNGTGVEETLLPPGGFRELDDWSRDGHFLTYSEISVKGTKSDLWYLPMTPEKPGEARKPSVYLNSESNESQGQFSPDGHWVAYVSDETGRQEIYVQPFPLNAGGAGRFPVSNDGGVMPRWSRDGKELFFVVNGRTVMSADVTYTPSLKIGIPKPLFEQAMQYVNLGRFLWDVAPDGRFLIPKATATDNGPQPPITVVLNWMALLKK
jgi:serine/threonine protein kinase